MNSLRIFGIMLIAVSVLLVTIGSQNVMASPFNGQQTPTDGQDTDIDVEEAAEAGNATMTAAGENETANGNMTGTNSTS